MNRADPATWCLRCPLRQHEDLLHLLWTCPAAKPIWTWITHLINYASPGNPTDVHITPADALLGTTLLASRPNISNRWWQIIGGAVCWAIWKARCEFVMDHVYSNGLALRIKTWASLKSHLYNEWDNCRLYEYTWGNSHRRMLRLSSPKPLVPTPRSSPSLIQKLVVATDPPRVH